MFGSCGALVSVLQRFKKLKIGHYLSSFYVSLRGLSRLLLGTIFGGFIIIAHHSGLALNFLKDGFSAVLVFSFVAGISERYVPELVDKISELDDK